MTLDEQLQRTFDTLSDRLRAEIVRELQAVSADVAAQARIDREAAVQEAASRARREAEQAGDARLSAAVAEAEARTRQQADAAAREEIGRLEQHAQEMFEAAAAESREQLRAADLAASDRLLDAIRAIDRARSLSEILDTLVSCAGREAARVGLLLTRAGELRGWRFIGFDAAFDDAGAIVVPPGESGIIGEAIRTGTAVAAGTSGERSAPTLAQLPAGRESLAVPVIMSGEVAAVLYADQGVADDPSRRPESPTWLDTLELFARHAARCLEAATAIKAVRVLTERPDLPQSASAADTDRSEANGDAAARRSNGDPSLLGQAT